MRLNSNLADRLHRAIKHMDAAITDLHRDGQDDDGRARSLLNDLSYLHKRVVDRLLEENERAA